MLNIRPILTSFISLIFLLPIACSENPPKPIEITSDLLIMPSSDPGHIIEVIPDISPMTSQELNECGKKITLLNQGFSELEQAQNKYDLQKRQLVTESQTLESARTKVNLKKPEQVKNFNNRLEEHRLIVKQYNTGIKDFNSRVAELKKQNDAFNEICASHSYHHSDFEQLPKALKEAIDSFGHSSDQFKFSTESKNANPAEN
jgi:chromosome segregation ATPase